jgi:hypothetical protein
MNEKAIIVRKIKLKKQAIALMKNEIRQLIGIYGLHVLRGVYEEEIKRNPDNSLNRKLDCLNYLLED